MVEDSVASDVVVKETLYQAYLRFCNKHKLAILSKEILGKILKKKYEEGREPSGKRQTVWKGIKLTEEYTVIKQETLDVSENSHESNISCYYLDLFIVYWIYEPIAEINIGIEAARNVPITFSFCPTDSCVKNSSDIPPAASPIMIAISHFTSDKPWPPLRLWVINQFKYLN